LDWYGVSVLFQFSQFFQFSQLFQFPQPLTDFAPIADERELGVRVLMRFINRSLSSLRGILDISGREALFVGVLVSFVKLAPILGMFCILMRVSFFVTRPLLCLFFILMSFLKICYFFCESPFDERPCYLC